MHRRDSLLAVLVLAALPFAACQHEHLSRKEAGTGMNINTAGFLGDASVNVNLACARAASPCRRARRLFGTTASPAIPTWCSARTRRPQVQSSALLRPGS